MIHTRLSGCSPDLTEFVPLRCSVDPISAAFGGLAGMFMGGGNKGSDPTPAPQAPPPQAAPQRSPTPKPQNAQGSSFIGGVPTPPPSTGQKTLLGQ